MARLLWLILSQSFHLTVGHLKPPLISRGSRRYRWSRVLHRFGGEMPSKVGAFDETMPLNLEAYQWFGRVLQRGLADKAPHESLVNFIHGQNSQKIREITGKTDLDPNPTWYQIRHSVVSLDLALGRRTRKQHKARGPRAQDFSRRRYSKGGRLAEGFKRLWLSLQPEGVEAFNRLLALLTCR